MVLTTGLAVGKRVLVITGDGAGNLYEYKGLALAGHRRPRRADLHRHEQVDLAQRQRPLLRSRSCRAASRSAQTVRITTGVGAGDVYQFVGAARVGIGRPPPRAVQRRLAVEAAQPGRARRRGPGVRPALEHHRRRPATSSSTPRHPDDRRARRGRAPRRWRPDCSASASAAPAWASSTRSTSTSRRTSTATARPGSPPGASASSPTTPRRSPSTAGPSPSPRRSAAWPAASSIAIAVAYNEISNRGRRLHRERYPPRHVHRRRDHASATSQGRRLFDLTTLTAAQLDDAGTVDRCQRRADATGDAALKSTLSNAFTTGGEPLSGTITVTILDPGIAWQVTTPTAATT